MDLDAGRAGRARQTYPHSFPHAMGKCRTPLVIHTALCILRACPCPQETSSASSKAAAYESAEGYTSVSAHVSSPWVSASADTSKSSSSTSSSSSSSSYSVTSYNYPRAKIWVDSFLTLSPECEAALNAALNKGSTSAQCKALKTFFSNYGQVSEGGMVRSCSSAVMHLTPELEVSDSNPRGGGGVGLVWFGMPCGLGAARRQPLTFPAESSGSGSDVLERPCRRRRGVYPPPPPLPMFEADSQNFV